MEGIEFYLPKSDLLTLEVASSVLRHGKINFTTKLKVIIRKKEIKLFHICCPTQFRLQSILSKVGLDLKYDNGYIVYEILVHTTFFSNIITPDFQIF